MFSGNLPVEGPKLAGLRLIYTSDFLSAIYNAPFTNSQPF
jgi:hypothetical protein